MGVASKTSGRLEKTSQQVAQLPSYQSVLPVVFETITLRLKSFDHGLAISCFISKRSKHRSLAPPASIVWFPSTPVTTAFSARVSVPGSYHFVRALLELQVLICPATRETHGTGCHAEGSRASTSEKGAWGSNSD